MLDINYRKRHIDLRFRQIKEGREDDLLYVEREIKLLKKNNQPEAYIKTLKEK